MKRTIAIKLDLCQEKLEALVELQDAFSAACNRAAEIALREGERNRVRLHHLCYYTLRKEFPKLGAQMCCNAIAKVAQALKALRKPTSVLFKNGCSVHLDKRTYTLKGQTLSLFTLDKRIHVPLKISSFHQSFLSRGAMKEAELVRKGKRWFFHIVLDIPDVLAVESTHMLAVDWEKMSWLLLPRENFTEVASFALKGIGFWHIESAFKATVLKPQNSGSRKSLAEKGVRYGM